MNKLNIHTNLVKEWHPTKNIESINKFSDGSGFKAWWVCLRGHEWEAIIRNRVRGSGCPYCASQAVNSSNCLATTNPEFIIQWHPTKNTKKPTEITKGSGYRAWWICSNNHEWESPVRDRVKGNNCPICGHRKVCKDTSLANVNPQLAKEWHPTKNKLTSHEVLPKSNRKVWWICPNGHEWESVVAKRTEGKGCPYCEHRKVYKDTSLAKEWYPTKNTKKPTEVTCGSTLKVQQQCSKNSKHEWEAVIDNRTNGDQGRGCPLYVVSAPRAELHILEYIQQYYPEAHKARGILENKNLELDIYIPSLKLAIEYCGQHFHYEDVKNGRNNRHQVKYLQAKAAGIRLITIFSSEYLNNWCAVEGYLKAVLHLPTQSIFARKCEFRVPTNIEYDEFMDKYHIQGMVEAKHKYGLFFANKLVAAMGFNSTGNNVYNLNRFCVPSGVRVVGGASKLLKHAIEDLKTVGCKEIISFSDNRWSEGNLYRKLGFTETGEIKPDYQYFQKDTELFHKFGFRRKHIESKLGPMLPGETEFEAMIRFGFHRIWDYGKKRWSIKL